MDIHNVLVDLKRLESFSGNWKVETLEPNGLVRKDKDAFENKEQVQQQQEEEEEEEEEGQEPSSDNDLAAKFAPALEELKTLGGELGEVEEITGKVAVGLASRVLAWDGIMVKLEENQSNMLNKVVGNERKVIGDVESVNFDIDEIRDFLDSSQNSEQFAARIKSRLQKKQLVVPMWWVYKQNPRGNSASNHNDTTHQDTRDIQRDSFVLNGSHYVGSDLKYDGVIELLSDTVENELKLAKDSLPENDEMRKDTLRRFSRVILTTGNRTHSGGNAFEAIMLLFGGTESAIITPDSEKAEPISIDIKLECFNRLEPEKHHVHTEFGIVARISGITKYLLKNPNDVENSVGGISANFQQCVALSLPIPNYSSTHSIDNRHSIANREDYLVWESADTFFDGHVTIADWNWDNKSLGAALDLF